MFFTRKKYENSIEFLKSDRYQNISCTVNDMDVKADENGKKYVPAGTLLDDEGKAVNITRSGSAGSYTYTLSGVPAGILFDTVEVTYGPQPGALMIDGSVRAERLSVEYAAEAVQELMVKLPFIKFFVDDKLQVKEG